MRDKVVEIIKTMRGHAALDETLGENRCSFYLNNYADQLAAAVGYTGEAMTADAGSGSRDDTEASGVPDKGGRMIGREQIETVKIEPRNYGEAWNIMLFVRQKGPFDYGFGDLVTLAAEVLGEAKGLSLADGWGVRNAEVMAWSDRGRGTGVHTPYEYRVTLDMRRVGCEGEDGDGDEGDDGDDDSTEENDGL